jgi:hypothetical protein
MMIAAAREIWQQLREFKLWMKKVEKDCDKTKRDVDHLDSRMDLIDRRVGIQDKIIDHQGREIAQQGKELREAKEEIKKLTSERNGKARSAGIAKKKLEKMREEMKADPKPHQ